MLRKSDNFSGLPLAGQHVGMWAIALGLMLPLSLLPGTARAQETTSNRSFFTHAPRLVRTAASFQSPFTPSTYQFTVTVPENAGAPLQALRIVQAENFEKVNFDRNRSSAFLGNSFAGGTAVSLANIGGEAPANPNEVTVMFDQPIQPGQTVTVSLEADRNPTTGGIYQFGVTAFPVGETGMGIPLGYGRVTIYDNSQ